MYTEYVITAAAAAVAARYRQSCATRTHSHTPDQYLSTRKCGSEQEVGETTTTMSTTTTKRREWQSFETT